MKLRPAFTIAPHARLEPVKITSDQPSKLERQRQFAANPVTGGRLMHHVNQVIRLLKSQPIDHPNAELVERLGRLSDLLRDRRRG